MSNRKAANFREKAGAVKAGLVQVDVARVHASLRAPRQLAALQN
jgi:hypothetical protein